MNAVFFYGWIHLALALFCIQNASSTLLGRVYTFRRKSSTNQSQAVIDEAVEALEGLHVDKHLLKGPVWDNVKIHAARVSHKLQALDSLLGYLRDPYARVVPKQQFVVDCRRYRGVKVSLGLTIKRIFSLRYLEEGFRDVFLPFDYQSTAAKSSPGFCGTSASYNSATASISSSIQPPTAPMSKKMRRLLKILKRVVPTYLALGSLVLPVVSSRGRLASAICCCSGACVLAYKLSPYLCPAVITATASDHANGICIGDAILQLDNKMIPPLPSRWLQRWLDRGEVEEPASVLVMPNPTANCTEDRAKRRLNSVTVQRQYEEHESALQYYVRDLTLMDSGKRETRVRMGYLQLKEFISITAADALGALEEIRFSQNASAVNVLVLDLRDNRGGIMAAALELASFFVPYNQVLSQVRVQNNTQLVRSNMYLPFITQPCIWHRLHPILALRHLWSMAQGSLMGSKPLLAHIHRLVLLVNGNTASASEIFVEAVLHHHPACVTVGSRTVGKNKAQAVIKLTDGTGLCFSVCEFCTPSGRSMELGHEPTHQMHLEGRRDVEEFVRRHLFK